MYLFSRSIILSLSTTTVLSLFAPVTIASPAVTKAIAQDITVRIDGQSNQGSGVIVDRDQNSFYVLTNAHVVNQPSQYQIVTVDGMSHPVNRRLIIPGVDLALLSFTSDRNYVVAV